MTFTSGNCLRWGKLWLGDPVMCEGKNKILSFSANFPQVLNTSHIEIPFLLFCIELFS